MQSTALCPKTAFPLVPAIYNKSQSAEGIMLHIKAFPEQRLNKALSYDHALEFQIDGIGPVGTLSEIAQIDNHIREFIIYPRSGDGMVHVAYDGTKFVVLEWFGN